MRRFLVLIGDWYTQSSPVTCRHTSPIFTPTGTVPPSLGLAAPAQVEGIVVQNDLYLFRLVPAVKTHVASPSHAALLRSSQAADAVCATAENATAANTKRARESCIVSVVCVFVLVYVGRTDACVWIGQGERVGLDCELGVCAWRVRVM